MNIAKGTTVKDLATHIPGATQVLEDLGIDFCCGGAKSLEEACAAAGINPAEVLSALERVQGEHTHAAEPDFQEATLQDIICRILDAHHAYVRQQLPRLAGLLDKVISVHGGRHPELQRVQELFQRLDAELSQHMQKEETILFPYIVEMEQAIALGKTTPIPFFGTARNPIRMMTEEHDSAGHALQGLRQVTSGFSAPPDGCTSFRSLYQGLEAFELDLHQHIHLENNFLFPRAIVMEDERTKPPKAMALRV